MYDIQLGAWWGDTYNATARNDFKRSWDDKLINATPDKKVIPKLKTKLLKLQSDFPNQNIKNIQIQVYGSSFDVTPFLTI